MKKAIFHDYYKIDSFMIHAIGFFPLNIIFFTPVFHYDNIFDVAL